MPTISLIVPVYNAEKYLPRCIDSILAQTYTDFELLLIDDGSPDNCPQICDDYAKKDTRIRVFHKENGGVASARQLGTDEAKGKYSIHVDSDDWVEPNMLEEMYAEAKDKNLDILVTDFYNSNKDKNTIRSQKLPHNTASDLLVSILSGKNMGSLWNKLIRHSLYKEYNVKFVPNINYCEDVLICAQLLIHENLRIGYLNKAYYYYVANPTSITQAYTREKFEHRLDSANKLEEIVLDSKYRTPLLYYKYGVYSEAKRHEAITSSEIRTFILNNPILLFSFKQGWKDLIKRYCYLLGIL